MLIYLLAFLIGGLSWRVRGSSLPLNDTEKRYLVWGLSVAILISFQYFRLSYCLIAMALCGVAATLGYWGQFDISVQSNRNLKNYLMLTVTAMFRLFPLFLASWFIHAQWETLPGVIAGIIFVPAYFAAFYIYPYISKILPKILFDGWTSVGEFLFGGTIFTALAWGIYGSGY